jgi:hypothetical protein
MFIIKMLVVPFHALCNMRFWLFIYYTGIYHIERLKMQFIVLTDSSLGVAVYKVLRCRRGKFTEL